MLPLSNIRKASSLLGDSLQQNYDFDGSAAAVALLSFTTPQSSHGIPSRKRRRTSSTSAHSIGGFFPAQYGLWDTYAVHKKINPKAQVTLSPVEPLPVFQDDRTALALKLARQRASQGLSEGREEIEAADFLTALRSYTAPSGATFHQIVTRHHDLNDKAINVIDNTDPDATEDEEGLENEQPIATGQEDIGKNVSGTLPICEIANGKRKRESNRPKFMIWTNVTNPPTIISNTPRSKAPLKRQSRPNTNASTSTASKHLGFLNQTLASIAAHKHKKAPPTPRKSTSTGNSPTSEESASSSSAKPVVTLPTPPLRACNESVVDKKRRRSTLVKNKLTTMPEEIDDEEVECMEKLERTSRSGRTIKETKKWTTLEYRNT